MNTSNTSTGSNSTNEQHGVTNNSTSIWKWLARLLIELVVLIIAIICFCTKGFSGLCEENEFPAVVPSVLYVLSVLFTMGFWIGIMIDYAMGIVRFHGDPLMENARRAEEEKLAGQSGENFFKNAAWMCYRRLNEYYGQTQKQAKSSFWFTAIMGIVGGFVILGTVIVGLDKGELNEYEGIVALVACISGVIIEFITAFCFKWYTCTVSSMSKYHNKLAMTYNSSMAWEMAKQIGDEERKHKAMEGIIFELMKDYNTSFAEGNKKLEKSNEPQADETA